MLGWMLVLGCMIAAVALAVFAGGRLLTKHPLTSSSGSGDANVDPFDRAVNDGLWTDASKRSQLLEGFHVKVIRAELGEVLGRDGSEGVQTLQKDGLQIGLEIRNTDRETTKSYQSWYAASREGEAHAQLSDSLGNVYPLLYFADVDQLRGHTASAELAFGQRVRDVVFFEVPTNVDRNRVTCFYLRLSAAPLGTRGHFQFRIPISMVQNWQ